MTNHPKHWLPTGNPSATILSEDDGFGEGQSHSILRFRVSAERFLSPDHLLS